VKDFLLFLLSWLGLGLWLLVSAMIFYIGAAFGGSWTAFTVGPPLAEDPLGFVLWLAALCFVFAPVVLIPVRLLIAVSKRGHNAPNR
jgi:hypothetical protein